MLRFMAICISKLINNFWVGIHPGIKTIFMTIKLKMINNHHHKMNRTINFWFSFAEP